MFQSCPALEVSDMAPLQNTPNKTEQRRVLTRPPVFEEYIHVTASDGTRVYMAMKEDPEGTGAEVNHNCPGFIASSSQIFMGRNAGYTLTSFF